MKLFEMSFDELLSSDINQLFGIKILDIISDSVDGKTLEVRTTALFDGVIYPRGKPSLPVEVHDLFLQFEGGKYLQMTIRDISEIRKIEDEKTILINKLTKSSQKVNHHEWSHPRPPSTKNENSNSRRGNDAIFRLKELSGLLPICSGCKKIRDDQGYWVQVEEYIESKSDASFSHSLCPDCAQSLYPEYIDRKEK